MDLRGAAELQKFILQKVKRTGKILGSGSFGTVEQMSYDHAPCAGKILHETLINASNVGASDLIKKFEQECKLLKELRYPHIVQFLGLCFFDNCKSPVIIMELLNDSVDNWIKSVEGELPLSLKCNILRDTAKGLYHLHSHSPQIIHRDLTARNVLLTKSMVAKIADLGNACIVPPQHLTRTMTRVPGTISYMPPEALNPSTCYYSSKLDIFSFGHLSLYVLLQEELLSNLLAPVSPDPKNPELVIGRSEVERRKHYMDMLYLKFASSHEVSSLIRHCLSNNPDSRPSALDAIKVFEEINHEHQDEYQKYDCFNRYDFAEKLKRDKRGLEDSGGQEKNEEKIYSRIGADSEEKMGFELIKEKIKSGEKLPLQMFKKRKAMFRKEVQKWKQYSFRYTSQKLEYYGDMNRAPLQTVKTEKIESVESLDGGRVFEVTFRGNEQWLLKAGSKEEMLAWVQVLQPRGKVRMAPPIDLPPPPPPPPNVENASYEPIDQFLRADYMMINPKSRNSPPQYSALFPRGNPLGTEREQLKQAYQTTGDAQPSQGTAKKPQLPAIVEDKVKDPPTEAGAQEKKHPEKRLSRMYSVDQLGTVMDMLLQASQVEGTPPESPAQSLYDDIVTPPASEHQHPWGFGVDRHNYVDMGIVDATYYDIPDSPKKNLYTNVDATPPLPPKPRKPKPAPRLNLEITRPKKAPSIDEIISASSKVSNDLLFLHDDDNGDADDEDDNDLYVTSSAFHRPDWAKARMRVANAEEIDKFGLEDELLNLLTLDMSQMKNIVLVAEGNFGVVYKAILTSGSESVEVAIKSVKSGERDEIEKQNFIREMCTMSKLLHPNIVRLYGLILKEQNFIVLEYMHNGDLGTFLQKNKRSVSKLNMYMIDIALGMHHISNLGLVHRDLAARNVLVDKNETCKMADFGLMRELSDEFYLASGATKVPIRWCAPEFLKKKKYYPASDVWSYAIVLWEMVYPGEVPYKEYQDYEVAPKIMEGEKLAIPPCYPDIVQKIMRACWHMKPERRPSFQYIAMLLTKLNFST